MSSARSEKHHRHKRRRYKKRVAYHWTRTLYVQLAAYGVVLALWVLPIPNPVKLLAVTFHELSHAIMALATGGRVFGYAIAPGGGGVTLGIGGSMFLILIAGYIGSCLWGVLLYYLSVKWRPVICVLVLEGILIFSSFFGWLNEYTFFFGAGAFIIMSIVVFMGDPVRLFVVRMIGSACCLYAPIDVLAGIVDAGGAPAVMGVETASDVAQLSALVGIHPFFIGVTIIAAQIATLVWLVRLTCSKGAKRAVKGEMAETKVKRQLLRDIHPEDHRFKLR